MADSISISWKKQKPWNLTINGQFVLISVCLVKSVINMADVSFKFIFHIHLNLFEFKSHSSKIRFAKTPFCLVCIFAMIAFTIDCCCLYAYNTLCTSGLLLFILMLFQMVLLIWDSWTLNRQTRISSENCVHKCILNVPCVYVVFFIVSRSLFFLRSTCVRLMFVSCVDCSFTCFRLSISYDFLYMLAWSFVYIKL